MKGLPVPAPLVAVVTFPEAQILDVTGPVEVFSTATRFLPQASYRTEVVSSSGGAVAASCGMQFATRPIDEIGDGIDTLVVAGGADMNHPSADTHLVANVRRLAGRARRVTSVCSGAFLLAAAGLLAGRRATTHWKECGLLERQYPDVSVEPDAIYVRDDNVWTSAGVTAGIDLALGLVAEDHGRSAAATVARQLVVYLRRSAGLLSAEASVAFLRFMWARRLDPAPPLPAAEVGGRRCHEIGSHHPWRVRNDGGPALLLQRPADSTDDILVPSAREESAQFVVGGAVLIPGARQVSRRSCPRWRAGRVELHHRHRRAERPD